MIMGFGQIYSDENLNLPKLISIVRPEIETYSQIPSERRNNS